MWDVCSYTYQEVKLFYNATQNINTLLNFLNEFFKGAHIFMFVFSMFVSLLYATFIEYFTTIFALLQLTVKLPFFITAILPYAAVRGEELELKIVVNNYGDADDICTVTIDG